MLSRIAHKHASLGIRPEQYQIVHDNLMWAIGDVLGDAVTPGVAAAWEEVYWLMAYALINQERGLHSARGVTAQTVWRPWRVAEKIPESDDVLTLVFASAGIGVTPMAGVLSHLVTAGSHLPVTMLHADVNEQAFALRRQIVDDLAELPKSTLHVWYEDGSGSDLPVEEVHRGLMRLDSFPLPGNALYYLCGPLPFLQSVRSQLIDRGVAARDMRYEMFGPDLWLADTE